MLPDRHATSPLARRALLSGLVLAGPAAAQPARPRVGEVTAVRGSAYVRYSAEALRSLAVPDPLRLDDLVTTGLASRLAVQLSGGIGLTLGERASLLLDRHAVAGLDPGTVLRLSGVPCCCRRPRPGRTPSSS
ncbi:hypothetical protein ACE7GA_23310 [Roseomonas sp. CCTCC AB2023176]|uniref:hypothetical protein n=1 Tax=Roseomonas sp. CCTCC AB2023176 TaxID=3342640 RepID=UPI0035DA4CAA